jgi:hypothetical protein
MHSTLSLHDFISQSSNELPENVHLHGVIHSESIKTLKKKSAKGLKNLTFTDLQFENEVAMSRWIEFINSCWGLQFLEIDLSQINDLETLQKMALLFKQIHIIPVMHLLNLPMACPELVNAAKQKAVIFKASGKDGQPDYHKPVNLSEAFEHIKNLEDDAFAIYMCRYLLEGECGDLTYSIKRELCLRYVKMGDLVLASQYDQANKEGDKEIRLATVKYRAPYAQMSSSFDSETSYWFYYLLSATQYFDPTSSERIAIENEARAALVPNAHQENFRIVSSEEIQQVLTDILKINPLNLTCRIIQKNIGTYDAQKILRIGEHPDLKRKFEAAFGTSRLVLLRTFLDESTINDFLPTLLSSSINAPDATFYKAADGAVIDESSESRFMGKVSAHLRTQRSKYASIVDTEWSVDTLSEFAFKHYASLIAKQFSEVAVMLFGMSPGSADIDIIYHSIINLCLKKSGLPELLLECGVYTPEELITLLQENTCLARVKMVCEQESDISNYLSHLQGHKSLIRLVVLGNSYQSRNHFPVVASFLNKNPNVKEVSMSIKEDDVSTCSGASFNKDQHVQLSYKSVLTYSTMSVKKNISGHLTSPQPIAHSEKIHTLLFSKPSPAIDYKALSSAFAVNGQLVLSLYWMLKNQTNDVNSISGLASVILALSAESRTALFGSDRDAFLFLFSRCATLDSAQLKDLCTMPEIRQCYALLVYSRFDSSNNLQLTTFSILKHGVAHYINQTTDLSDHDVCLLKLFLDAMDNMNAVEFRVIAGMIKDKFPSIPMSQNTILIEYLLAQPEAFCKEQLAVESDNIATCVVALLGKEAYLYAKKTISTGKNLEEVLKSKLNKEFTWFNKLYTHYEKGIVSGEALNSEKAIFSAVQGAHLTPFVHYCAETVMWHVVRDIMMDLSLKMGLNTASSEFEDLVAAVAMRMRNTLTEKNSTEPVLILKENMYHNQVM